MPRFGLGTSPPNFSSFSSSPPPPVTSPPFNASSFSSPPPPTSLVLTSPSETPYGGKLGGMPTVSGENKSVNLCCSSVDGQTLFSLGVSREGGYFLERQTLPLRDENNERSGAQRAQLPNLVQAELELSPPVELFCVEADAPHQPAVLDASRHQFGALVSRQPLPMPSTLLCLYSRKNVFYLEMHFDPQGEVIVKATEVYQHYFETADDAVTIIRIRPAPQRRKDFATLCPRGAMAMLTHLPYSNEYSLVLQHSKENDLATMPVNFLLEEMTERDESIADFCFAQSDGLSLLSTMTVLLLKGSGEVLAANPVLFEESVIHRSALNECMEFLNYQINIQDKGSPKYRQCVAARQYLSDGFAEQRKQSNFLTAKVLSQVRLDSVMSWPVKVQGPVLATAAPQVGPSGCSVVIENFPSGDLVGVAIGGENQTVDLGLISPSCLLPRFAFESYQDACVLDDDLSGRMGAAVQRLMLSDDQPTEMQLTNQSLALVRDPLMDTMLHYVTSESVITITTTAMRRGLQMVQGVTTNATGSGNSGDGGVRTCAWASVISSGSPVEGTGAVVGTVVGTDPRYGHCLIARIPENFIPVNVSESRYLQELEHLVNPEAESNTNKMVPAPTSVTAMGRLDSLTPLYTSVEPLLKKVSTGLSSMGKIVGTQTSSKDITPDMMAVALKVKERCDKEVVLPLLELKQMVGARRGVLQAIIDDQMQQVAVVRKTIKKLQDRMAALAEKAEKAQTNSAELAKRSDSLLQASRDLLPSLTLAEMRYFQELKRMKIKVEKDEKEFNELGETMKALMKNFEDGFKCDIDLGPWSANCEQLLDGQNQIMAVCKAELEEGERMIREIAEVSGFPQI